MHFKIDDLQLFFIGLLINGLLAIPLISFLYNKRFYKVKESSKVDTSKRNPNYYKHLLENMDTPSSFGVLILINVFFFQVLLGDIESLGLSIVLSLFVILGLFDDMVKYFGYEKYKRWGLTSLQKLAIQLLLTGLFLYYLSNTFSLLFVFSLLFIVFITNSVNIIDGLDGLLGTICIYIFPTLIYFESVTQGNANLMNITVILFSFLFIFLYFNIKPARVFLGDAGSLPLGLLIAFLGLRYNMLPILVLFGLIIIDGLSSLIQIFSIKVFKKRVFVIAPLHLHLLNKGWADTKIVQRAGIIQLILSLLSLYLFNIL